MKAWKLVSGILSIIFSIIVCFQTLAVSVAYHLGETDSRWQFVWQMLFLGGIISIVSRNNTKKYADRILIIIFGLSCLVGLFWHGIFTELIMWGIWCGINTTLAFIDLSSHG